LNNPSLAQSAKANLMSKFNTPSTAGAKSATTTAKKTTFSSTTKVIPPAVSSPSVPPKKLFQPTTPSMTKQAIANRMLNNMKTTQGRVMTSACPSTPSSKPIVINDKRMSRTVDCAKSIKRRSINFLNVRFCLKNSVEIV
jgi:hypothetical protein